MKISRTIFRTALAVLTLSLISAAQEAPKAEAAKPAARPAPTVTSIMHGTLAATEKQFVDAADAMPAEKYDFAPAEGSGDFKGVRTFAQQVKHVGTVNYLVAHAMLGEKSPYTPAIAANGPDELKTKAEIMDFLKGSFTALHKAMDKVDATTAAQTFASPFGNGQQVPFLRFAALVNTHAFDHYGQMVVYLRMNGIVPPASRG